MATIQYTDQEEACAFLGTQAATIERALRAPLDEAALDAALRAHDESHEDWVHLLTRAERYGDAALRAQLTALYEFHGRLAESLERGLDGWVHVEAACAIRAVLADRLASSTMAATAAVMATAEIVQPAPL